MMILKTLAFIALGKSFVGATPAPDSTRNVPAAQNSVGPQPGCPSPISITNGGFESGKIAPWTLAPNSNPTTKQRVVTPGYNSSKYALQADFAADSLTEYTLTQSTTGQECYGYYYNISYAWNWVKYSGPEGPGDSYCALKVFTGYTEVNVPLHYGTRKPGWHYNSYIARDIFSHCKPASAAYVVDITCLSANSSKVLPAFSVQIDNLNIRNAPGSPNPPPSGGNC